MCANYIQYGRGEGFFSSPPFHILCFIDERKYRSLIKK
ncbi:hypothetical protein FH5_03355 [Priestia endophytica]|nr:hypothetical protein FH5_03355 [Priestia endophytica]